MSTPGVRFFSIAVVITLALIAAAAAPLKTVRLEMWEGCLCAGPTHSRNYDQLKEERAKRMLFGTDAAITIDDRKLSTFAFLASRLGDNKLKDRLDFFRYAILYRRGSHSPHSYSLHSRAVKKFKMRDLNEGDLIIFYQETY
jgi:hypothetical protein